MTENHSSDSGKKPQDAVPTDSFSIDFSSLTVEHRKESRFLYRSPLTFQTTGSMQSHAGFSLDLSRTGIGMILDECQLKVDQEIILQLGAPNETSVAGRFRVSRITTDVFHGKTIFKVGLSVSNMTKVAEFHFFELLKKLEQQHGFSDIGDR